MLCSGFLSPAYWAVLVMLPGHYSSWHVEDCLGMCWCVCDLFVCISNQTKSHALCFGYLWFVKGPRPVFMCLSVVAVRGPFPVLVCISYQRGDLPCACVYFFLRKERLETLDGKTVFNHILGEDVGQSERNFIAPHKLISP